MSWAAFCCCYYGIQVFGLAVREGSNLAHFTRVGGVIGLFSRKTGVLYIAEALR